MTDEERAKEFAERFSFAGPKILVPELVASYAEVRREERERIKGIVEKVDTEVMHSCNVPFCEECRYTDGHHRAIDEILRRISEGRE